MEIVALYTELYLPGQLRTGDPDTDKWWRDETSKMATAWREKKKWILNSKADTQKHFVEVMSATLIQILTGNWDALERSEWKPPAPRGVTRILSIGRLLLIAILPLVLLWGVQYTPLAPAGTFHDLLTVGVFIWAVGVLLAGLDSAFGTRVAALKELTSVFLPSSNK